MIYKEIENGAAMELGYLIDKFYYNPKILTI